MRILFPKLLFRLSESYKRKEKSKVDLDKPIIGSAKYIFEQSMLKVSGPMVAARILTILTGAALSVLLARSLAPEGYGLYLFALNVAQMLAMPVLAGLPTLVTRQIAIYRGREDPAGLRGVLAWAICFISITSLLVATGAAAYFFLLGGSGRDASIFYMAIPLVVFLAFMHVSAAILRGFEHHFRGSVPDGLARPVLLLLFVAAAVYLEFLTPWLAMAFHVVAVVIALLWAAWTIQRHCMTAFSKIPTAVPRFETRTWLTDLLPLTLITAASMINARLDILMLGFLTGETSVGIYGLAAQIAGVTAIGQTIFNSIAGPRIARLWDGRELSSLQELLRIVSLLGFLSALACVVFLILFGSQILTWLVGEVYEGTVLLALVISVGVLITSATGPATVVLHMTGYERVSMKLISGMALSNAALNLVLIPAYGAIGAAIASVISILFYQSGCMFAVNRIHKLNTSTFGSFRIGRH